MRTACHAFLCPPRASARSPFRAETAGPESIPILGGLVSAEPAAFGHPLRIQPPCSFPDARALPKTRLLACLLFFSAGCINENEKAGPLHPHEPPETADFPADTVKAWLDLLTAAIDAENLNPPEASRRIGYAGVTLYEAVVAGMPDHRSLGEQLNELPELPEPPDGDIHWPSAANAALADVMTDLFSTAMPATLQSIADLKASQAAAFALEVAAGNVPQADVDRGVEHGEDVAAEIIDWIAGDGYAQFNDCPYTVPTGDGLWEPTPPGSVANPLEPCWGELRTFALLFGAECAPLSHPPFSRSATAPFAQQALEVYEFNDSVDPSDNLTPVQQAIANFWEDGEGTLTPPGHWVSITGQVLEQEGEDLDVAAEAYAKVGIAVADAIIACWKVKYVDNLLRPITYIRDPLGPINDPAWTSFITTPPFPEFTSGHSTQSGAAAVVLTDLLGDVTFTDHTHDGAGLTPRSFTSFSEAADEAAISRLLGGINYRSAIERGQEQGECVGLTILREIQFQR